MKAFILLAAVAVMYVQPTLAKGCNAAADAALAANNITNATLSYVDKISGKKGGVEYYHYWYRVPQCDTGYVVVNTNFACEVTGVYTRGGCQIQGLDNWPWDARDAE